MKHGTAAGYNRHRENNETPCVDCACARADYQRVKRARTSTRIQVPVDLVAELYLAAPPALQVAVERAMTTRVLDALVARLDAKAVSA